MIGAILALSVSPFIMASTENPGRFVLNGTAQTFTGDIYVSALTVMQVPCFCKVCHLRVCLEAFGLIVSYNLRTWGNKKRVKECFRIAMTFIFPVQPNLMLLMILFPFGYRFCFYIRPGTDTNSNPEVMPVFLAE